MSNVKKVMSSRHNGTAIHKELTVYMASCTKLMQDQSHQILHGDWSWPQDPIPSSELLWKLVNTEGKENSFALTCNSSQVNHNSS